LRKLLIDLDRTLFDTTLFVQTLWDWIEQTYGISADASRYEMKQYFTYVGEMYNYDFFKHIADLGIDGNDLATRARAELTGSFAFDDVVEFLRATKDLDRAILTFGADNYQQFKISLCSELSGIDVHMTQGFKHDYIETHWPDQSTLLIDDRLLEEALPSVTRFILIDRTQKQPVIEQGNYRSVNSLAQFDIEWLR
jgi:beta-phosphoglucomutase-like phosphatase (HAD superfamily)